MKDIEKITGSSLDHFLILDADSPTITPTVTFTVKTAAATTITIKDADNSDWEGITLVGSTTGTITQNSFVTKGNAIQTGLSLLECLKKNAIFFNFKTPTINGTQLSITCNIEMSRTYTITSSNASNITVTTSSGSSTITKYIVDMDVTSSNGTSNLSLERIKIQGG